MMVAITERRRAAFRCFLSFLSFLLFDSRHVVALVNAPPSVTRKGVGLSDDHGLILQSADYNDYNNPMLRSDQDASNQRSSLKRRSFVVAPVACGVAYWKKSQAGAFALDCLSDLPALPRDSVRIYLCRHGETDLNKLHLVQARADPPLNVAGDNQARLLGGALSRALVPPGEFLHSPLKRAQRTAEIAASAFPAPLPVQTLSALTEVDFGISSEGRPVQPLRPSMIASYTAWALGDLDVRMIQDGENGREILQRVKQSVETLVERASNTRRRSVAAVSHSAFLRMMLATILNISLYEAVTLSFANACINVVDYPLHSSFANNDAPFLLADGRVLRLNERGHLTSE